MDGFNRYVFSSVGSHDSNVVITVVRPFATFAIAAAVFAVGALLMYVPALHHPLVLLGLGCSFVALAVSFPQACLAAAQTVAVGLAFVLVARLMMGVLTRQPVPRLSSRPSNSGLSEPRSSKTMFRRMEAGSGAGTATISAPLQMSATGNEP